VVLVPILRRVPVVHVVLANGIERTAGLANGAANGSDTLEWLPGFQSRPALG
jgi:hypothetical protein